MIINKDHWKWNAREIDRIRIEENNLRKQAEKNSYKIEKLKKRQKEIMEKHELNKTLINHHMKEKRRKKRKTHDNIRPRHRNV